MWQTREREKVEREANHRHHHICSHLFTFVHNLSFIVRGMHGVVWNSFRISNGKSSSIQQNPFAKTFLSAELLFTAYRQRFASAFSIKKRRIFLHIHQNTTLLLSFIQIWCIVCLQFLRIDNALYYWYWFLFHFFWLLVIIFHKKKTRKKTHTA